jgi:alkylhydroperoxidase/carboxymuconolactone decarboxylase family protein YurZ
LTTLRQYIKGSAPSLQEKLDKDYSLRKPLQRDEKDARGKDFFSNIYGQHTEKVLHNLSVASGGDLAEFAINAVYGDLMAETSRLDAMQTSLLEFVACYATGGTTTLQAKSHMYGSHNLGNTRAEIKAATAICDAIEAEMQTEIDRTGAEWSWLAKADEW